MSETQAYDLENPAYYFNRELSWLDFNKRVLEEAQDATNPLFEQLNFLGIASSNLDEFFMIRVAGLQDQEKMDFLQRDGKTQLLAKEQLEEIAKKNRQNIELQYQLYGELTKELEQLSIRIFEPENLAEADLKQVEKYFYEQVYPALTPLGIDAYRPFPNLNNKLIHVFVNLGSAEGARTAIVPVPALLNRYLLLEKKEERIIIYIEDIIRHFIGSLFNGFEVLNSFSFRITRNADLDIQEDGADDLLLAIQDYLKQRKNGMAVRLEIDMRGTLGTLQADVDFLTDELELKKRDVYFIHGPLDLTVLSKITGRLEDEFPLVYPPFEPVVPPELQNRDIYEVMDEQDIFVHHPYDSFQPVIDFIQQAAEDEETVAIKQTLYRVSNDSPIIQALKKASENGKQVTVLVELKARFDEEQNVQWAQELEEAGVHVLYGMTRLKTHSKIAMVIKKKKDGIVRYVHLGTGNYNDKTARIYTDMGLFTTNKEIGEDATDFFNYLSGYSIQPDYRQLHVSPFEIRLSFLEYIEEEIESHKQYGNGRIIAKMNSLTDKKVIMKLYEASQAGVRVDLIIRGICCLRPQIPGISDNIHVRSIVGRFLEHSRIYYFHANGAHKLFLSSADMMTRNMIKRVEIEFPILDTAIKTEILGIMDIFLKDSAKTRILEADGSYHYLPADTEPVNAQELFMEKAENEKRQQQVLSSNNNGNWFTRIQARFRK